MSVDALDVALDAVRFRRDLAARLEDRRSSAHRLGALDAALETLTALRETFAQPLGGTVAVRSLS